MAKDHIPAFIIHSNQLMMMDESYLQAVMAIDKHDRIKYKESMLKKISMLQDNNNTIPLTTSYDSPDINPNSMAYYFVDGAICAQDDYGRYFSSKGFEQDFLAAEQNDNINVHFLHVSSGGGEGWYLDRLSETLSNAQKPIYAMIERICGSAAYYIACHADTLKALTQNDLVGCIGSMCKAYDISGMLEQMGIKEISLYADQSDLKNKKYNDAMTGKPKQFITEELDPMAQQFIDEVRNSRSQLADLPDDDPILRGETFTADVAVENGLIDGIITLPEALIEAYQMGMDFSKKQSLCSMFNN